MIKVLIADDQKILREGLKTIINMEKDIEVCSLAENGQEAFDMSKRHMPDVVLMDIKMPILNGVEATKKIKETLENVKVIVLTTFNDDEYIFDALRYGASGYLLKDATPEQIIEAIRTVHNGGALIPSDVAVKVIDKFSKMAKDNKDKFIDERVKYLTDRELVVSKLIADGKNNKEMSEELFLSEGTIKNHITNILNKLELRDRTQLAVFAIKNNI